MEVILCFASYQEKQGGYKDITIDLNCFDRREIIKDIENYYKSVGIEEFFLADAWTDDSESVNKLILKNYSENYVSFINYLDSLKEYTKELEGMNEGVLEYVLDTHKTSDISDIIDYYNNIEIIEDIQEWFINQFTENNRDIILFSNILFWLSESQRVDCLREQGYLIYNVSTDLYIIDNN